MNSMMDRNEIIKMALEQYRIGYRKVKLNEEAINKGLESHRADIETGLNPFTSFTEKYLNYNFKGKKVLNVGSLLEE